MRKTSFFKDLKREYKQIVWPKKNEVVRKTTLVIVISFLLTLLIFGLDTLYGYGLSDLLEKFM